MAQARLVTELKLALDQNDYRKLVALVESNPRSAWASHVQRNIGKRRSSRMSVLAASLRRTSA